MNSRVFFDTNIMLDLIQERPGYKAAARILQKQENGEVTVCMSTLSIADIAYVLRKTVPSSLIVPTLKQISSVVEIVPMDGSQLQKAFLLNGPDFEDLMQLTCAVANGCTKIITHNPRDFRISKGLLDRFSFPDILSPEEFELT
jgi:predicted nucleic acid-binding protein